MPSDEMLKASLYHEIARLKADREALRKAVEEAVYLREIADWPKIRSLLARLESEES
mgnify:FL=1